MAPTLIPLFLFGGIVAIVLGAYYLFIIRDEEKLVARLKPKGESSRMLRGVLKQEDDRDSSVAPINRLLQGTSASGALREFLRQAGFTMNVASFLLLSGCLGLAGYLVIASVTGLVLIGAIAGVLLCTVPYAYAKFCRTKRIRKFEEQFPESIDLIARALRAGHALPTGLGMVADEMPAPVGTEFRMLYDEQNFGLSLPDAMRNFATRVPLLDARFFVTAVLTQRESGGNLAEVLDNLASVIRDRFKVKRQVRVISAHGRITGVVLSALPPCLAVAILFLSPDHIRVLTGDPIGHDMIYAAIVMQILGTIIIRKLCNIEY